MSRHARVEEVSSSDPDSDPEEMDISDLSPALRGGGQSQTSLMTPSQIPSSSAAQLQPHMSTRNPGPSAADRERTKTYQCLYPLYFDASRSRSSGRRVSASSAVRNPLARDIVDAVAGLGFPASLIVFEPSKTHPNDWANPGRVRVCIKKEGEATRPELIRCKGQLYEIVGRWLREHPTTEESPNRLRIQGLPLPDKTKGEGKVNVPRGWKMGGILPLHSPARSGGGVSEDMFKEMMEQMQKEGGGMPGLPGMGGMGGMGGGGMPDMSQMAKMLGGGGGGGPAAGGSGKGKRAGRG